MSICQKRKLFLSFKSTILFFLAISSLSFSQSKWELINPLPPGQSLTSVTYGNGKFVAVGYYDTILTSPDGKLWTKINLPSNTPLLSVAYGESLSTGQTGMFMAVGQPGSFLTSPDGMTWTIINLATMPSRSSLAYGNGQFIAVDYDYAFSISTDGMMWKNEVPFSNLRIDFVTYCNNQFIALDNSMGIMKDPNDYPQPDTNKILTSVDGSSWTIQNIFPINCNSAYPYPPVLNCITYGNCSSNGQAGQFVAFGYHDTILTSPDGIVWTAIKSVTTIYIRSVIFGNGQFVAVGDSGTIITSPDGTTWTQQNSGTINTLFSVTYANGLFIAVGGNGIILTSKADPVEASFQTNAKLKIGSLKINIAKNCISAILPTEISRSQLKVGLFNVAGKQIYSTTTGVQNGILNIPVKQFPTGKYFMSITDEKNKTLNSAFVLTR